MDLTLMQQLRETDLFAVKEQPVNNEIVYRVGNEDGSVVLLLTKPGVDQIRQAYKEKPEPEKGVIFVEGLPIPLSLFLDTNK